MEYVVEEARVRGSKVTDKITSSKSWEKLIGTHQDIEILTVNSQKCCGQGDSQITFSKKKKIIFSYYFLKTGILLRGCVAKMTK